MHHMDVSKWLKGATIAIAVMGLIFFCGMIPVLARGYFVSYPELEFLYWPSLVFCGVTAIFCYAVLYQFWKVCIQMGKDDPFSLENATAFKRMSQILVILAELWAVDFVILLIKQWLNLELGIKMLVIIFIWIIIAVLTAALSNLIMKAYELKQENELTI